MDVAAIRSTNRALDGRRRTGSPLDEAITMAKAGDRDAIRYLYVRYADSVYGYTRSILRESHDAEDVTQQVFAKLIQVIGKYEPREVPFTAWILRVAHNLAIDHIRRQRMIPCDEVRAPAGTDIFESRERSQALRDAFAELPDDQRQVLVLRHIVGLSPGEIADRLGKTEGSVHGLHHRGRSALREALIARGAAPAAI
jgi:RNA polymerase sigma-70 factor (ECF subfamily)